MIGQNLALGLVGWPLRWSASPTIHRAALQASGLRGSYRCLPVPPDDTQDRRLAKLVSEMRRGVIDGLNITIPHKTAVLPFLDGVTDRARDIGAVNTLFLKSGRILGENTDAEGFLRDCGIRLGLDPEVALVLGAGGAARAVVYALIRSGWEVHLSSRSIEKANRAAGALEASLGQHVSAHALDRRSLGDLMERTTLVVHATPAGSVGSLTDTCWPSDLPLPAGSAVYDLVYAPSETPLLHAARQAGLRTAGGLGMLVEQAALSFELWTETEAPRRAMQVAVGICDPIEQEE